MRVVGGSQRVRRLVAPVGEAVRPTSDRAREALFNILSHGRFAAAGLPFADRPVLDAFAGTGALGLEAVSRGASAAAFIESDRAALAAAGWLAADALAIVEVAAREELPAPPAFTLLDERVYGAARLVFLRAPPC